MNKGIVVSLLLLLTPLIPAQNSLNNISLFNNSIVDASTNPQNKIDANFVTNSYAEKSFGYIQLRGSYNISDDFVIGGETTSREGFDAYYAAIGGRYNYLKDDFRVSFGSMLEIPLVEQNWQVSVFTAIRYAASDNFELAGSFRLRRGNNGFSNYRYYNEEFVNISGIYSLTEELKAIGELNMQWEAESLYAGGGFDYKILPNLSLRWAGFVQTEGTNIFTIYAGASYVMNLTEIPR